MLLPMEQLATRSGKYLDLKELQLEEIVGLQYINPD